MIDAILRLVRDPLFWLCLLLAGALGGLIGSVVAA